MMTRPMLPIPTDDYPDPPPPSTGRPKAASAGPPEEYLASDVAANVRIELDEVRAERDRALASIATKVTRGKIRTINPEELERAARLIRDVRLLAPILERNNLGG